MKKFLLFLVVILTVCFSNAQTVLEPGDIAFLGVNTDGTTDADDSFAFVLLKDVDAATTIIFTDRGWNDGTGFVTPLAIGDGEFTWTAGSVRSAGEVVILDFSNLSPGAASFTVLGDQLFALQGTIANPVFIAGMQLNIGTGSDDSNWDGASTSNTTSALPDALTTGDTAVRLTPEADNWQFSCAVGCPLTGTPEQIRAILHNPANWVSDNDNVYPGTVNVNFGTPTIGSMDNTPPTISSLTPLNGAIDVAVDANLVVEFNEDVQAVPGNNIIILANLVPVVTIPINDSQVTIVGSTLTINPTADLPPDASISIGIPNGGVEDLAGNDFTGIDPTTGWVFTTAVPADDTPPAITLCPEPVVKDSFASNDECGDFVTWEPPTATDNLPGVTLTSNYEPGDLFPFGTTEVIYTATDATGNQAECKFMVTLNDKKAPTPICINGLTVTLDATTGLQTISTTDFIASPITDPCGEVTYTISLPTNDPSADVRAPSLTLSCDDDANTIVRIWAEDVNGNSDYCETYVIVDKSQFNCPTPPVITCPADVTVQEGDATDPANTGFATATDGAGDVTITFSDSVATDSTITRTWVATDENGATSSCDQIITIIDNTPPVAVCKDIMLQLDPNGKATVSVTDIYGGSSDSEGSVTYGIQRRVARIFDQNATPDAIFGSGNANGSFTINQTGSVELGLRAKVRYPSPSNTFNSNGDGTYAHLAGAGTPASRALWNFEWSVNTDPTGADGTKLDGLTYEMGMDFDPSIGTDYFVFDPINQPLADHAIGTNMTANGGGTTAADPSSYAGLLAANNVAQNSWNLDFFNELAGKTFDPTVDGTYDVYLKAFDDSGARVGETKITVIVGNGGAPGMLPQSIDFTVDDIGNNIVELIVVDEAGNTATCISTVTIKSACEVVIEAQPIDAEICAGDPLSFDVGATGNGILSYQWQVDTGTGFEDLGVPSASSPLNFAFMQIGGDGNQYRVIVTSDNGTPNDPSDDCTTTSEAATLTVNPAPMVEITGNDSYCHDGNGLVLDAGAGFTKYEWSTGADTQTIVAAAGSYRVTVTNASGCITQSEIFTVTNNEPLYCSIDQDVLATNHQTPDGVATVNVTGGSGQYTYLWDNGEITQTATTLTYGMHSVTVTDTNGCETTCHIDIAKELYCWTNLKQNVSSVGGNDGSASVKGNGGYRPYTFKWEDGSTDEVNTSLSEGTHYVTITDATGAISRCSVTIAAPSKEKCSGFVNTIEQNELATNHLTEDGVATVYTTGGTGNLTYLWDNGETTQTATRLTYGMHSVTVTDAYGCETIGQIDIAKELYCWTNVYHNVSTNGASDGKASVTGNGGFRPYTFTWGDGSTGEVNSSLTAGTHYVTITDATGATSNCSVTISEPGKEVCDGVDNDGDGKVDEGFDQDGDGIADCYDKCDKGDDSVDIDHDGIPDACDDNICVKTDRPVTECYETAVWNEDTCSWNIEGMQPEKPVTECYETAVWNGHTCSWDIVDGQPEKPVTECYEMAVWNEQTCSWDVTGEQPIEPVTECYETATWNPDTCSWDVTGQQPERPDAACYGEAVWNGDTCSWDVTGEQPEQPVVECYQTATFNGETCEWDVTGEQPIEPVTECYETATWNPDTCEWDVTGERPEQPVVECYQTATFNEQTCEWDVTGEQPGVPETECNETAVWNDVTCEWDIVENGNDADGDGFCSDVDCDDNNPDVFPGATELCDGIDNNCVNGIDEGLDCNTGGIDQCETAFARSTDENVRSCFLDIPDVSGNRWGWVNEFPSINGTYEMEVYAAAGQCDISKGALVGNVQVVYTNGSVDVTVTVLSGYKMTEAQLHVGTEVLPRQGGGFTAAPGQYANKYEPQSDFTNYTFEDIGTGDMDSFYVVVHANVCPDGALTGLPQKSEGTGIELSAYPVPFGESLNLNLVSPRNMQGSLSLFNGIGQKVLDFGEHNLKQGDNALYLNTGELPEGMYFVRMNSVFGNETLKVIRR